jgi:hypothetical protein
MIESALNYKIHKDTTPILHQRNATLQLKLPANPTPTSTPFRLRVFQHAKAASYELGDEVDGGAVQEREGDCVYEDVGWCYGRV